MNRRRTPARGPPGGHLDFPVVGIGASAGGLDACKKLLQALPARSGMAFIIVQHLDPNHKSMLVDLLAEHTSMTVRQATIGMTVERDHLYIIPPGSYLSIGKGALHLSQPRADQAVRLPFDFLLRTLAAECGANAVCVVLSGTGGDGSLGLKTVKENGGLVVVQDPDEAGYDGMPRSAIMTGAVDLVLPVAEIADALLEHGRQMALARTRNAPGGETAEQDWLTEIIDILRQKTAHDFGLYKRGTLQRRVERRMAMQTIACTGMDRYLEILRRDEKELDLLAKDLLINVTSFFRDPHVFDLLSEKIVPELIRSHPLDQPLRIWTAGCSTGEEAYSLAMIFREQISAVQRNIKLQVFASDVDPEAIASAREGLYPETIEADVSPARLARFFSKEDHKYLVTPDLRATIVFTVQDVLSDPPFSRLDLVSCRNMLIYLRPDAQAKVISLFHFALREGGLLLLGSSETAGNLDGRFEAVSKVARLYRHVGHGRPRDLGYSLGVGHVVRVPPPTRKIQPPSRQSALAELCQRLIIEACAPAAILINRKFECLYYLGPTDRYLMIPAGNPVNDLLAMVRGGIRTKLRSAIQRARESNSRIVANGERTDFEGNEISFNITVQPVLNDGEELFMICFIDEPKQEQAHVRPADPEYIPRIAELENELKATKIELEGAIHNLESSSEEQKAINEEALSVSEEFQSTNEELLTSKEELQSLNEELTALNGQLQETLERQRTTSNDLQNVLYSTDVATLFLDAELKIRFFTPAVKSLFSVIPGDIGRPLADLNSLASDGALLADAKEVLLMLAPIEREIEARNGAWYMRRILPYRTQNNGVEGVVITFADITERRRAAHALEDAERQAQLANIAKSRFLAAASHDLRQPLQTLVMIQGLMVNAVEGERARNMVARFGETLGAMSGMLDALLDINQIEAGTLHPEIVNVSVNELFDRLRNEFTLLALGQGLELHVVPCDLKILTDPHLLEQMIRNLLSNALKYTKRGKILLGCRRRKETLTIEIWDTGIGIPEGKLAAIFEEYHQLDNSARELSRGLGLGLFIVQRFGALLGHRVYVRSRPDKGSVFAIEVVRRGGDIVRRREGGRQGAQDKSVGQSDRTGAILIIEDDPQVRDLLELHLRDEKHYVVAAPDGPAAMELVARGTIRPDIILADYNLPNGMDGLQASAKLREELQHNIPVVVLTGDISTDALRNINRRDCVQLNKPVKLEVLTQVIQALLPASQAISISRTPHHSETAQDPGGPVVFVVDDDSQVCEAICAVLKEGGRTPKSYQSSEAFLEAFRPSPGACVVIDAYLPGMSGLELLQRLNDEGWRLPAIMMTGKSDVAIAVQAMKACASDFLEKPINGAGLLASIDQALERWKDSRKLSAWREAAADHIARLTEKERRIMLLVLAGQPNKNIAADLGISRRTVENHRASIMKKTGSKSLPALARLALAAGWNRIDEPPAENEAVAIFGNLKAKRL